MDAFYNRLDNLYDAISNRNIWVTLFKCTIKEG